MSFGLELPTLITFIFGLGVLFGFVILCSLKQENIPVETYRSPFVPLFPCAGILANLMLAWSVD